MRKYFFLPVPGSGLVASPSDRAFLSQRSVHVWGCKRALFYPYTSLIGRTISLQMRCMFYPLESNMSSLRTASPRQIERNLRNAQRHADSQAGGLSEDVLPAASLTISPVATNPVYFGGELWVYEAHEAALLANGLVRSADLPKAAPGSKIKRLAGNDLIQTLRMKDGRVRLTISAHLVRVRDVGFVDFLARTVGSVAIRSASKLDG